MTAARSGQRAYETMFSSVSPTEEVHRDRHRDDRRNRDEAAEHRTEGEQERRAVEADGAAVLLSA